MVDEILVGIIKKPFGLKGAVFIDIFNKQSNNLAPNAKITVKKSQSASKHLTIKEVIDGGRVFFDEILTREDACALKGAKVFMQRSELKPLKDDEFYLVDLIGVEIFNSQNEFVGKITDISTNNAQDLLVVNTFHNKEAYIPLVRPFIKELNIKSSKMIVDIPEGLLDL